MKLALIRTKAKGRNQRPFQNSYFGGRKEKVQTFPWRKGLCWHADSKKQSSNKKQQTKATLVGREKKARW